MTRGMACLIEDSIPTRYSLLSRLQNWDDQESWKEFFDTYWRLIYSCALKSGLTESEAQDVVQETVISVAKDIHKFKRDRALGSFKGWLRNITRWRIADQLRKRTRHMEPEDTQDQQRCQALDLAQIPDPAVDDLEAVWEADWQANLMEAAIQNVRRQAKEEFFQMFHLYVVQQWPAGKVARTLGVNVGQVYLAKHRVLGLIKKEARRLEKKWE